MRILLLIRIVGQLLWLFAFTMLIPAALAALDGDWDSALRFTVSCGITAAYGWLTSRGFTAPRSLYRAEALGVVAFTWLAVAFWGALPYVFVGLSPVDAMFESMSGFTTTGATLLADFGAYDRAFFLWRSMTQWFGGLGVIALFVVVLPRLGIAGRQLFFAEASGAPGEAVSPKVRSASGRLWMLYGGLTALLAGLLLWSGMDLFNAVCHALTTMSAGGFSPNPESIAGFDSAQIEWILIGFMILAGTSFPLLWTVMTRKPLQLFRDGEFLFYLAMAGGGAVAVAILLHGSGLPDMESFRTALFQSASLISSTGYASTDYNLWSEAAKAVLILVMVVGGCAGSAAGGPKAIRHLLVAKHVARELRRVIHPRAVLSVRYKGAAVGEHIMRAVFTLVVLYIGGYFVFGMILALMGVDLVTAFSASLACLGNIGPGFGPAGPMGNFAFFSDPAKLVLTFAMWIGRLEIVTVLALLHPHVLRDLRLGVASARGEVKRRK